MEQHEFFEDSDDAETLSSVNDRTDHSHLAHSQRFSGRQGPVGRSRDTRVPGGDGYGVCIQDKEVGVPHTPPSAGAILTKPSLNRNKNVARAALCSCRWTRLWKIAQARKGVEAVRWSVPEIAPAGKSGRLDKGRHHQSVDLQRRRPVKGFPALATVTEPAPRSVSLHAARLGTLSSGDDALHASVTFYSAAVV